MRRGTTRRAKSSAASDDRRGVELHGRGRTGEAISAFRRALAADPSYASAACNLGKALLDAGDIEEAIAWLERAIDLEPNEARFYLPLIAATPGRVSTERLTMLETLANRGGLPEAARVDLYFALGNAYERDGRVDDAFRHYCAGNAIMRAHLSYDHAEAIAFLRSLRLSFTNPIMHELRGCGDASPRPVFIVGMPRSGSTLVEQVLAAHPSVAGGGELGILGPIVRAIWPRMRATTPAELRAEVRRIGERYLRETSGIAPATPRFTDKTLDNLQLLPLINVTLPGARMIHVTRDPLDTCWSCFATLFAGGKVPFAYDLSELREYYAEYERTMEQWRAFVPPDRLLEVSYERLVDDFEREARRIVAFCGLQWDDACRAFFAAKRPVRTASNAQVRRPLYRSSIGRAQAFRGYFEPLTAATARESVVRVATAYARAGE